MSTESAPRPVTVAVLGGGTVGTQLARLLTDRDTDLHIRMGTSLKLTKVAVRCWRFTIDRADGREIDAASFSVIDRNDDS